jgi:RNA polymerase sigma-70 factor (ECF subfamily)
MPQMGVALLAEPPAEQVVVAGPSDDDLIALALSGRGDAFGTLVERYERAVYYLALRTMREAEEAKDAAKEAWIKAYRALASFRPGAKFATWIFTICYRVCCDRLAKRKRFTGEEPPDVADPAAGPEQAVEAADDALRLRAAIAALPEKYRVVITLFHLQGRQYEEIAAVLDLPLGTVKTHLFRAKDLLRAALGPTAQRRTT